MCIFQLHTGLTFLCSIPRPCFNSIAVALVDRPHIPICCEILFGTTLALCLCSRACVCSAYVHLLLATSILVYAQVKYTCVCSMIAELLFFLKKGEKLFLNTMFASLSFAQRICFTSFRPFFSYIIILHQAFSTWLIDFPGIIRTDFLNATIS